MRYIYKTTNLINGKTYIGQHKSNCFDSYLGSGTVIVQAFKKYGKENFSKEILFFAESQKQLDACEIKFIKLYKLKGKAEYNVSGGGQGQTSPFEYKPEDEKKKIYLKMGKTRKGKPSGSTGKTWKQKAKNKNIVIPFCGKKVICMETEEIFNSARNAEKQIKINGISKACKGIQDTSAGYHWKYLIDYDENDNPYKGNPRGELGYNFGRHFDFDKEKAKRFNREQLGIRIMCIETGEKFNSAGEAAELMNLMKSGILSVLNGRQHTTGGFHFVKIY